MTVHKPRVARNRKRLSALDPPTGVCTQSDSGHMPVQWLQSLALSADGSIGNLSAATVLAKAYLEGGLGLEADFRRGVDLLFKAALQRSPDACFTLATLKSPAATSWEKEWHELVALLRNTDSTRWNTTSESSAPGSVVNADEREDVADIKEALQRWNACKPPYYFLTDPDKRSELVDAAVESGIVGPWNRYRNSFFPEGFHDKEELRKAPWAPGESYRDVVERQEYYMEQSQSERDQDQLREYCDFFKFPPGPQEVHRILRQHAEAGDSRAQILLAHFLIRCEPLDSIRIDEAYQWLQAAAVIEPEARFELATSFDYRDKCTEDRRRELLEAAAFPDPPAKPVREALLQVAQAAERNDPQKAMRCYRQVLALEPERPYFPQTPAQINALESLTVLEFQSQDASEFDAQRTLANCEEIDSSTTLLIAGLIHLRGISVERDVQAALKLFDEAGQRPDESFLDQFASFWARQASNLSVSHRLRDVARRLTWRLNSNNDCEPDDLALLTVADVDLLLQQCGPLESDLELAMQSHVKANLELAALVDASPDDKHGTLWGIQDERLFIRGLVYCLQTLGNLDVKRLSEYWGDKYSLLQRYLWGRLYASFRFGAPDYALALEHFDHVLYFFEEGGSAKPTLDVCKNPDARWLRDQSRGGRSNAKAQHAIQQKHQQEAQHETEVQRAREEERRQMVSFLSHTLTSATAGGSKTIRKITSKLASAQANIDLPHVARRLAAQVSRMARVESLVEVFKLYTSDDKALREGWDRDTGGDFSVLQVCAMAIQQALLRFYFSSEHEADFSRLMPEADYATVSHEFMTDALALDMSTPDQARQFIDWLGQRLPFLRLSFGGAEAAHLSQGGARDIVIFALTGEFLGNALKYAAAGQAIALDIRVGTTGLEIVCRNSMKATGVNPIHGGKTGLTFIRRVCALISAEFDEPTVKDNVFILRALLPIQ